ncbi:MAG: hypothetical protein Q9O62_00495 [Ardenticatenia bacterium]|nr:hypothetical protein [Ardenticatenia bacterium]
MLLEFIPPSIVPPAVDFGVNLFDATAIVENRSGETLYITPITTTPGRPKVIPQLKSFRQRDIPLEPNHSIVLEYDATDSVLAGIVVCRATAECRLLTAKDSGVYYVEAFDNLTEVEPSWLVAIQSYPRYNFTTIVVLVLCFVPIMLFLSWLYLGRLEKAQAG